MRSDPGLVPTGYFRAKNIEQLKKKEKIGWGQAVLGANFQVESKVYTVPP